MDKQILLRVLLDYYEFIKHGDAEHQAWLYNSTLEFHKKVDLTYYTSTKSIELDRDNFV